jgi:ABC-type phosphate transport system substrate-binding protein
MPDLSADWSNVSLVNLPGPETWPITLPTMLYVPTDMTQRPFPGQLLKALVTFLLSDEVQGMLPKFGEGLGLRVQG